MSDIPPAPPFRPLKKIVARGPDFPPTSDLQVGDLVDILMEPKNGGHWQPFWRRFEVTVIDGDKCRLVTPDKRFHVTGETKLVKELRDIQRRAVETKALS